MELVIHGGQEYLPTFAGLKPKIVITNVSKPYSDDCQIKALNDLEAVNVWLNQYQNNKHTFMAYSREAKRLLLWCIYERGITLGQLKVEDIEQYFAFLKAPPGAWCTTRAELRIGQTETNWRPFLGPLNQEAFNMAIRVINSLLNYLVEADYLRTNALKLIKKRTKFTLDFETQKYKVWERMLEDDEWEAIQTTLNNMPEQSKEEIDNKLRTQFLFALLYLLGLRIHEVVISSWNAFRQMDGNWWFFIKGKGGKPGHIPVNEQLLSFVKIYRLHLGKMPLPTSVETESLFISKKTKKPLQQRQVYSLVKVIGVKAAKKFKKNSNKRQKLEKLSPHWLRHLSASHQDKLGIPATIIQANHRHSSNQTTQLYLHATDELRATEMQKMQMMVLPKIITPVNASIITEVTLAIRGRPISEVFNLARLLNSIESNVFQGITWEVQGQDRDALLQRYEQLYIYNQPLVMTYQLFNVQHEKLDYIENAIIREADIRLFNCEVKIQATLKS